MKNTTRKCIVVTTFNRYEHLEKCLHSIVTATGFSEYNLIVVFQKGSVEAHNVIRSFEDHIDFLCTVEGSNKTPLHNINWNRYISYNIAFELFESEFVLGIEDDTVISKDALVFCNQIFARYNKDRKFKGINLGSFELSSRTQANSYSKLRYGLHGQAGVITKRVWKQFSSDKAPWNIGVEPLDSMLEYRLKTGYMVTSNRSRYLDRGWGGTHAPQSDADSYFINLQNSWVGQDSNETNFIECPIRHSWREDAVLFRRRDSLFAYLRFMKYLVKNSRFINRV